MTTLSVKDIQAVSHPAFDEFVATIAKLRAPDGCPWDKEQTHASIASNMIEEAYEAVDAIEAANYAHMREELGDVLLQVVLHAQIAADAGAFTIDDICCDVNNKIVRRHPHVFGDAQAGNSAEVLAAWDAIKLQEKNNKDVEQSTPTSLLDGVPASFPALMQAQKLSRKAASVGFDWDNIDAVWEKVNEEIAELKAAYEQAPKSNTGKVLREEDSEALEALQLEMGDVLFSLVNVARKMGLDAEAALRATCAKFRERWQFMEGAAEGQGVQLSDMSSAEMEELWQAAKLLGR